MYIKRRTFVRIISFLAAAVIALGGWGIYQSRDAGRCRTAVQNGCARSFDDLSAHLYNIETAFEKGKYASSDYQAVRLASEIWRETGSAKTALEGMPVYGQGLEGVSEFLSKAGDYAYYVASRVLRGETAGEDEAANMDSLAATAGTLANYIGSLRAAVSESGLDISSSLFAAADGGNDEGAAADLVSAREQVSEYPELIYDGPFSDHIEKQTPLLLEGAEEVSAAEAKKRLCEWLEAEEDRVSYLGETSGKIPAYLFETPECTASVTKYGGYLLEMSCSKTRGAGTIGAAEAMEAAQAFFGRMGITGMRQQYYMCANGEITMNFAYTQDSVTVYPDLIKVTVCLDGGTVCGYEAFGYIMAHREGRDTAVTVGMQEAREKVSGRLKIVSEGVAIIPTDGKNEVLCHEFVTETEDGRHVLVYINAKTGVEEMLQILIETEDGTLTV